MTRASKASSASSVDEFLPETNLEPDGAAVRPLSVLLGVSGSVAAVKLPQLLEALVNMNGAVKSVDVVRTEKSAHFLGKAEYGGRTVSSLMENVVSR